MNDYVMYRVAVQSLVLLVCATQGRADELLDPIFQIGTTQDFEIAVPRNGFIGSPTANVSLALWKPQNSHDFTTNRVRVVIVEQKTHNSGQRIVMRVDGLDEKGRVGKEGQYYCFLEKTEQGIRTCAGYTSDVVDIDGDNIEMDIRNPFNSLVPPLMGFSQGAIEGRIDRRGRGVILEKLVKERDGLTIKIVSFTNQRYASNGHGTDQQGGDAISTLATAESGGAVRYREQQHWDRQDDWIWRKMERYDSEGNILMRCTRIDQQDKDE